MALPEKLDGGRTIVIQAIPPGTGIGDLIGAFSPFGAIRFASVGPPAVVSFESEAAAAHALLVASMKSVSLLGDSREKHPSGGVCPSPTPTRACSDEPAPLNLNNSAATAPYVQVPAPPPASESLMIDAGTATRLSEARRTMDWIAEKMILECKVLEAHIDVIKQVQDEVAEHLRGLNIHPATVQVSAIAEAPRRKVVTIEYRTGVKSCSGAHAG